MNTSCDPVKPCTSLGHIYTGATVVRCPHRESWVLAVRTWRDTDLDEPIVLFEAEVAFGPFDSVVDIERRVHDLVSLALDHQRGSSSL